MCYVHAHLPKNTKVHTHSHRYIHTYVGTHTHIHMYTYKHTHRHIYFSCSRALPFSVLFLFLLYSFTAEVCYHFKNFNKNQKRSTYHGSISKPFLSGAIWSGKNREELLFCVIKTYYVGVCCSGFFHNTASRHVLLWGNCHRCNGITKDLACFAYHVFIA